MITRHFERNASLFADPGQLTQSLGRLLDHVEYLVPERPDQGLGEDRSDAADHARAKIALHALQAGRRHRLEEGRLELRSMIAIIHPKAACLDGFAGTDHGAMADHRDQIALAAYLDFEHGKAVVGIVESHALDQASEMLGPRCFFLLAAMHSSRLGSFITLIAWHRIGAPGTLQQQDR